MAHNYSPSDSVKGGTAYILIHHIRHSDYLRLFWGAMAAFLLNLSVDAPDPFPDFVPEDLSHNEQESITEWVVEHLLGYENAFAEYDDDDSEERQQKLQVKLDASVLPAIPVLEWPLLARRQVRGGYPPYGQRWSAGVHEIDAPPPQA